MIRPRRLLGQALRRNWQVTDGDLKLAEELRDELLGRAWVEREAFVYKIEPLSSSPSPAPKEWRRAMAR
jgi:hypothetical protein